MNTNTKEIAKKALDFIILMGILSLFSDMTHEGAKSILGDFLYKTGASASVIGFVSGFAELLGYSLRLVFGRIADKTKKYWNLMIAGYIIQVLAIPALCLVSDNGYIFACFLIILERVGKAIKKPAKSTLVSFAATNIGVGKGFAYKELLDQLGAFLGPVILFVITKIKGTSELLDTYRLCFLALGIPALITISLCFYSKYKYPSPEEFEEEKQNREFSFNKQVILFIIAICFFAFGFLDFPLITMHVSRLEIFSTENLSLLYALAMLIDAIAALIFGTLYDKIGIKSLIICTFLSMAFSIFIFLIPTKASIITGIILWGIGMGAEESVLSAAFTSIVDKNNRASAFGIFETCFGIFWFLGSWLLGFLYEINIVYLVIISVLTQLLAIIFYMLSKQAERKNYE